LRFDYTPRVNARVQLDAPTYDDVALALRLRCAPDGPRFPACTDGLAI